MKLLLIKVRAFLFTNTRLVKKKLSIISEMFILPNYKKASSKASKITLKINQEQYSSLKEGVAHKLNYLLIAILPISYFFLEKKIMLYMLIPTCSFVIAIDYFRHRTKIVAKVFNRIFSKITINQEKDKLSSASYFSIAALVIFIFFPKLIAINAFLILAISNSLATIVGKSFKTIPFHEKSLGGSAVFFTSACLIILIIGIIFQENILYYIFSLLAIYATTIVEARPKLLNLNNNLATPITYTLVMASFNMIWVYNY